MSKCTRNYCRMKKIRYDNYERRWYFKSNKMIYHDTRGFKSYLKNMIQKFFLLFLFLFLSLPITSAKDCEMLEDEFEKYECRSDKICKQYDENKKVFNTEKFKNVESYKEVEIGDILLTSGSKQK